MKKIILPILLLTSFYSFAFDYHGIKSGMSKEEVNALTGGKSAWGDVGEGKVFNTTMGINPPNLFTVDFSYTTDDKLWRITLNFRERSFSAAVAQQKALREIYGEFTKTSINYYSSYTMNVLQVLLIDDELFKQDADKIFKETIDLY
jgi:hypothetical protein